ncbi:uncharacterized protein LOC125238318 isoform X1 [Leguminivora glycinivorella]|uniref:uncharacterized protein LOC125238318 isoform X1 n=1 Tax=Leguminivora glycinivorella TaxID=1035111 RepID=UPI00200BA6FC|nr:uncharacterized protein LOC125238318 isoform X1 [Leguminivora glycinivorella]
MAEAHIGFLYNAASTFLQTERNETYSILRSHYLMRCMQVTKGYGLPEKHFSSKTRCPHCCTEWQRNTIIKVKPIKLSKRQKKRLKSRKPTAQNPNPKSLLHSNELERLCTFCKHSTVTIVLKPAKDGTSKTKDEKTPVIAPDNTPKQNKQKAKQAAEKKAETSIYYNAKEVFTLKNKNNALASTKPNKVIKNNKKKKDKFAGLCKQAVLTSAKLKEAKDKGKDSLLSKFLKTSS